MQEHLGLWSTQQLTEFLAEVIAATGEEAVLRAGVERAAETMEAEIGAALFGGEIAQVVGFRPGRAPEEALRAVSTVARGELTVKGLGRCYTATVDVEDTVETPARLLLGRSAEPFSVAELGLVRNMARVLGLALRTARTRAGEQALLASLHERQQLLERLARIVRSISHRAPLQEVLDAITAGACALVGDAVALVRQLSDERPGWLRVVSSYGFEAEELDSIEWLAVGQGAGGRSFSEEQMVVVEDYSERDNVLDHFRVRNLQSALALPVHLDGRVVGTLTIGSYEPGRQYSAAEQDALQALAEHASLAISDARLVQDMREAQAAKDLFLAMVSHELKTPLTIMMGSLRTLQMRAEQLTDEQRDDLLAVAYRRGADLRELIDRLLEGAKAELAGEVEVAHLPVLLDEALEGVQHLRRLTRGGVPEVMVRTDPQGARAVLDILVENAVAHSPDGATIEVNATEQDGHAVVTVTNPGSLPEELSREELFGAFRRGSGARGSGVGLGLFIADRLARHMEAELDYEQRGDRVCFHLRLPLAEMPA